MSNYGSLSHPHGLEEVPVVHQPGPGHLGEVGYPKIFLFWSYTPYMPNLGSISHSHGLEEVPVVHQPGPSHLGEVG